MLMRARQPLFLFYIPNFLCILHIHTNIRFVHVNRKNFFSLRHNVFTYHYILWANFDQ